MLLFMFMFMFLLLLLLFNSVDSRMCVQIRASWPTVMLGCAGVIAGLVGNIVYNSVIVRYFFIYFVVTVGIVMVSSLSVCSFR